MAEVKTVLVRPARDKDGNPKKVPRRPLGVLRVKGGEWPREAVKPEGEVLPLDRYIKRLLNQGDLERIEGGPGVLPVAKDAGERPASKRRKPDAGED